MSEDKEGVVIDQVTVSLKRSFEAALFFFALLAFVPASLQTQVGSPNQKLATTASQSQPQ